VRLPRQRLPGTALAPLAGYWSYITSGGWWISVFPGVAIILAVLAFNFLGDYADDKLRGRGW
jgi:ABC-type dipeptide/oligopeptide/nickel transport system permease subunit